LIEQEILSLVVNL